VIYEAVDPNANIIFGALVDEGMTGEISITVIATGFPVGASGGVEEPPQVAVKPTAQRREAPEPPQPPAEVEVRLDETRPLRGHELYYSSLVCLSDLIAVTSVRIVEL